MRTRHVLVLLVVGFATMGAAACGPMHVGVAPAVIPDGHTHDHGSRRAETPPPPPVAAPHLGCLEHPRIDAWEHRLRTQPKLRFATERSLERGEEYLPRLREIMEETGLPPSLALLPAVESGFRANARGHFGDLGLWQLRKPTARRFGLVVTTRRDDRLHPERATVAAARYLRVLHQRYHDWPLTLAAYNAGEARVDRARARHPGQTFWELADAGHLPRTSRDFVPRFLAVVRVSEAPGLCEPEGTLPAQAHAPVPVSVGLR
jgi:transglycosylase-like protein with SLT domain